MHIGYLNIMHLGIHIELIELFIIDESNIKQLSHSK